MDSSRSLVAILAWSVLAFVVALSATPARADEPAVGSHDLLHIDRGDHRIRGWARRTTADASFLRTADPGQQIEISALVEIVSNGRDLYPIPPARGTIVSIENATIVPGVNFYYQDGSTPDEVTTLPYTYEPGAHGHPGGFYTSGMRLVVRCGDLDKKGRAKPVRMNVRLEVHWAERPGGAEVITVSEMVTVEVPVSGAPTVEVSTKLYSSKPGQLRPGGRGTLAYTVTAGGSTMDALRFVARIPKGTEVFPGQVAPADGVVRGNEVTWTRSGVTRFDCSVGLVVNDRPGTRRTKSVCAAAAELLGVVRKGRHELEIAIPDVGPGEIEYYADSGTNGPVAVGRDYVFFCKDFDLADGAIFVTLNDAAVTAVQPSQPVGIFHVPPFRDPDLEHVLSAHQTGKPTDTVVVGEPDCDVLFATGGVRIVDESGAFVRNLRAGFHTATGEADLRADVGSTRFGLLDFPRPTSAAMLRDGDGLSLLYARSGDVHVFGEIAAASLVVQTGKGAQRVDFEAIGDFSAYDPAGQPGVIATDGPMTDETVSGFRRATNFSRTGPLRFNGGLLFVEGDATIRGDVTGEGAIIVTGSLTHRGKMQLSTTNRLVVGVGRRFTTLR